MSLIEQNGAQGRVRLPSENQLCLRFHASRVAVRHALSDLEERGLILRIQGQGTFINAPAEAPPPEPEAQQLVGCIMPALNSLDTFMIIAGATEVLARHGITLAVMPSWENIETEALNIRTLRQMGAVGMLIASCCFNCYSNEMLRVALNGFPTVQIDWRLPGLTLSSVSCDENRLFYDATDRLISKGHRTIGYLSTPKDSSSSTADCVTGYESCMRDRLGMHGCSLAKSYRDPDYRQCLNDFLDTVRPTALLIDDYYYSQHLKDVLRARGIRPMQDLDIAIRTLQYQDLVALNDVTPIILDRQPVERGRCAAGELLRLIDGKKPGERLFVPGRILEGEAVRRLFDESLGSLVLPPGVTIPAPA